MNVIPYAIVVVTLSIITTYATYAGGAAPIVGGQVLHEAVAGKTDVPSRGGPADDDDRETEVAEVDPRGAITWSPPRGQRALPRSDAWKFQSPERGAAHGG